MGDQLHGAGHAQPAEGAGPVIASFITHAVDFPPGGERG